MTIQPPEGSSACERGGSGGPVARFDLAPAWWPSQATTFGEAPLAAAWEGRREVREGRRAVRATGSGEPPRGTDFSDKAYGVTYEKNRSESRYRRVDVCCSLGRDVPAGGCARL